MNRQEFLEALKVIEAKDAEIAECMKLLDAGKSYVKESEAEIARLKDAYDVLLDDRNEARENEAKLQRVVDAAKDALKKKWGWPNRLREALADLEEE